MGPGGPRLSECGDPQLTEASEHGGSRIFHSPSRPARGDPIQFFWGGAHTEANELGGSRRRRNETRSVLSDALRLSSRPAMHRRSIAHASPAKSEDESVPGDALRAFVSRLKPAAAAARAPDARPPCGAPSAPPRRAPARARRPGATATFRPGATAHFRVRKKPHAPRSLLTHCTAMTSKALLCGISPWTKRRCARHRHDVRHRDRFDSTRGP